MDMRTQLSALLPVLGCVHAAVGLSSVRLSLSPQPSDASKTLDPRLASFSIELAYLPSFGGNETHPNNLTKELMRRLEERTGVGPDIRPGGITV